MNNNPAQPNSAPGQPMPGPKKLSKASIIMLKLFGAKPKPSREGAAGVPNDGQAFINDLNEWQALENKALKREAE